MMAHVSKNPFRGLCSQVEHRVINTQKNDESVVCYASYRLENAINYT